MPTQEMIAIVGEPNGVTMRSGKKAFSSEQLAKYAQWKKAQKVNKDIVMQIKQAEIVAQKAETTFSDPLLEELAVFMSKLGL